MDYDKEIRQKQEELRQLEISKRKEQLEQIIQELGFEDGDYIKYHNNIRTYYFKFSRNSCSINDEHIIINTRGIQETLGMMFNNYSIADPIFIDYNALSMTYKPFEKISKEDYNKIIDKMISDLENMR